ncbi:hypothetical protein DFH07DRAFT_783889 [Mycena maculata]|uniref:Uncharacterized protein n=1 Tax=Mycena maculata TaxID=230809 RepID=A0AAD7ML05_9AGAR|nr:hypothetical protein DFH07DRAFT_783889 [Mycena maculata]
MVASCAVGLGINTVAYGVRRCGASSGGACSCVVLGAGGCSVMCAAGGRGIRGGGAYEAGQDGPLRRGESTRWAVVRLRVRGTSWNWLVSRLGAFYRVGGAGAVDVNGVGGHDDVSRSWRRVGYPTFTSTGRITYSVSFGTGVGVWVSWSSPARVCALSGLRVPWSWVGRPFEPPLPPTTAGGGLAALPPPGDGGGKRLRGLPLRVSHS